MKEQLFLSIYYYTTAFYKCMSLNERINYKGIMKRGTFRDVIFI